MDGCGFVDTQDSSYVVIHMEREDLIDQIYELVVSLGHKVRKDFVHGRYRLNWRPLENPFRVGGEQWSDNPVRRSRHTARVIVSIEPVVAEASYCIEVDSPRHLYLAGDAMIPTHNSRAVGSLICHWVTTCEAPGDNLALVTGPALKTVRDVVWQYMNDFYGVAIERNAPFPGTMYSSLQDLSWRVNGTGDKKPNNMAIGLKPGDGTDIVGAFQGRRGKVKTAVFMDEAGSLHADIFTAAEAVTTGPESRILAIGNPDNGRGSEFFKVFNEPGMEKDWKHFTISAFMLPTFTGEIVYPGEPHKQAALLNTGMPDPEWVDNKRRMWGEGTSRWKAKVLGEFPDDDDNVLFSQAAIDAANSCDIVGFEGEELILGVDLAFGGLDETQVYANRGGHIRRLDGWSKATPLENARRIHGIALENGAVEVRVDAGGAGEGVYNMLDQLEEFRGVGGALPYDIIGMKAGNPSPDPSVWAQARSWWYDEFRKGMLDGRIDLSVLDSDLQDEIISQTYDINRRGALQVTPKKEMRRVGLTSPDHLDAAIMSFVDPFAVDDFESKTEMYDNDMMFETLDEDDFLADFRAYRW